jgi:hypothetical protein
VLLEGEEVAQRARPQRREQLGAGDRLALREREPRRLEPLVAGLDQPHHVTLEAGVHDLGSPQHADTRPSARDHVGHEAHA